MKGVTLRDLTESDIFGFSEYLEPDEVAIPKGMEVENVIVDFFKGYTTFDISSGFFKKKTKPALYYSTWNLAVPNDWIRPIPDGYAICPACDELVEKATAYASYGNAYYHNRECYDTLFEPCEACGKSNMTAKTNRIYHDEQLCDACRDKKHGWSSVTIVPSIRAPRGRRR